MTTDNLWPDVAAALDELNDLARRHLLPVAGDWVRQAWQGLDDRHVSTETWHIAEHTWRFTSGPIAFVVHPHCGRNIDIEPARDLPIGGCRYRTVDVRDNGEPGRECWHCVRILAIKEARQPG